MGEEDKRHRTSPSPSLDEQEEESSTVVNEAAAFFTLISPYLPPPSLASLSASCKSLHNITRRLTLLRISDATRSFENIPVPFVNTLDSTPYDFFYYTPTQILPPTQCDTFSQPWGVDKDSTRSGARADPFLFRVEGAGGCQCKSCEGDECCCLDECGPSCECGLDCGNRVSQRGLEVHLKIVRDVNKGWSLFANHFIARDTFVCEYAGELLTTEEAKRRQEIYDQLALKRKLSPALLVVREHLSSGNVCMRINVDATRIGNIARFINHSCDGGNLSPVIVRSSGALLPRICFFASRDIQQDEELTFSYGEIRLKKNGLKCFCGSSSCYGILPSENT